jgi:hypothetical protein
MKPRILLFSRALLAAALHTLAGCTTEPAEAGFGCPQNPSDPAFDDPICTEVPNVSVDAGADADADAPKL